MEWVVLKINFLDYSAYSEVTPRSSKIFKNEFEEE